MKYEQYIQPKGVSEKIPVLGPVLRKLQFIDCYCINTPNILSQIRAFRPSIIYLRIVGSPLFFLDIGLKLATRLKLPLVTHIMDDYEGLMASSPNTLDRFWLRRLFRNQLDQVFKVSRQNYAISSNMALSFSRRYSVPFEPLHNGIDPEQWTPASREEVFMPGQNLKTMKKTCIRLLHAGALSAEKESKTIKLVAKAVHELNKTQEIRIELVLNTQDSFLSVAEAYAYRFDGVIAQGYGTLSGYRSLLRHSDILIIARNFDEKSKAYTQYSFQNKLPEYMISGTPILCVGPEWENSVQFLKKHSAAKIVTESSVSAVICAIKELCQNRNTRDALADTAREVVSDYFNIRKIRKKFAEDLVALVAKKDTA
ncbi:hypothetical protein [uncultured Desulfobacter sp.]|uniref:hypothetical protein n=1 Tax=uncultured Desulfobacter sp. TaxID=240139 RepID=UPI002AA88E6B|nr:hypothetical protein [uncultured Desulfobacter sp.]